MSVLAAPAPTVARRLPGLLLVAALAGLAVTLAQQPWLAGRGLSALTLAIVLGLVVGHTAYARIADACEPGVAVAKQTLLRLGIVLYGWRLTFQDIGQVGWPALVFDALVVLSTLLLARGIGVRVLGLPRDQALLIGAGSAFCGAAAVLATAPVLRARAEAVAVAVATVVGFGTVAMALYPLAQPLLGLDAAHFGVYVGATVHEVAQVVVAARAVGEQSAATAVVVKLVRVMMLAPCLLGLSAAMARGARRGDAAGEQGGRGPVALPWFAFGFVAVAGLHSLVALPPAWLAALRAVDDGLLAMAMVALGLGTQASALRRAGARPVALAALLFAWLAGGGALLARAAQALAG